MMGWTVGDLYSSIPPWIHQAFQLPATLATTQIQARASRGEVPRGGGYFFGLLEKNLGCLGYI